MTQVLEGLLIAAMVDDMAKEEPCKKVEDPPTWQARINKGVGSLTPECDAQRLYTNMEHNASELSARGGKEPFVAKKAAIDWELPVCGPQSFPLQAHHIIPKNYLPTHDVCAFLGKGYKHGLPFKLVSDTAYDCDHQNNGYCLPYASALKEWDKARGSNKDDLAYCLMHVTGKQLHQGSHREHQYTAETSTAEEDDEGSLDHAQVPGYLGKVGELLNVVASHAFEHLIECRVCKSDPDKPETNPREATVRHVDQAAGIAKRLMDADFIFVSRRAFNFSHLSLKEHMRIAKLTKPTVSGGA